MNYNTNQWMILNYPAGAGGKFLAACFLQFKKAAHWAEQDLTIKQTAQWYKDSLPNGSKDSWAVKEIDTPWVLPASRAWPRGETLSEQEFNLQMINTGNEYFQQCWRQEKSILDFWHKSKKPAWWTNAQWINIYVDDKKLYKNLVFTKLFEYNPTTKIIISHDQKPTTGRQVNRLKKSIFNNQWIWENVSDLETFFDQQVKNLPWYQSWNFDSIPTKNYITLTELFDVDKVYQFLLNYEEQMNQRVDRNYVERIHALWHKSTTERLL